MSTTRRDIGRICRWALLALTGAFCLGVAWAAVGAVAEIGAAARPVLVAPDLLIGSGAAKAYYPALRVPRPSPRAPLGLMTCDDRLLVVRPVGPAAYVYFEAVPAADADLLVQGMPYTTQSFQHRRIAWRRVGRGERVVLWDAQTLLDLPAAAARDAMRRTGTSAALAVGEADQLARLLEAVDDRLPGVPVLLLQSEPQAWPLRERDLMNLLQRPNFANTLLVTHRADLAREWAGKRRTVAMLQRGPMPDAPAGVTAHANLDGLVDSLETRRSRP